MAEIGLIPAPDCCESFSRSAGPSKSVTSDCGEKMLPNGSCPMEVMATSSSMLSALNDFEKEEVVEILQESGDCAHHNVRQFTRNFLRKSPSLMESGNTFLSPDNSSAERKSPSLMEGGSTFLSADNSTELGRKQSSSIFRQFFRMEK